MSDHILKAIEEASGVLLNEGGYRGHLGASQIGNLCGRAVWYSFRWAYLKDPSPRMRRLWDRGHAEEFRFTRWLRAAGFEIQEYNQRLCYHKGSDCYTLVDWDQPLPEGVDFLDDVSDSADHWVAARLKGLRPQQWGFKEHGGHYAGSCDGKVKFPKSMAGAPAGWGLLEFKTHNTKSFVHLKEKGVLTSKPSHYVQSQCYMHELGLPWALYMAVNKNDDDLYTEVLYYKPEIGEQYKQRALSIIDAKDAPARLSNDPSWFECKFCDYREVCHYGVEPNKNCRSCALASASEGGSWYCNLHHAQIPPNFIKTGCDKWDPIRA